MTRIRYKGPSATGVFVPDIAEELGVEHGHVEHGHQVEISDALAKRLLQQSDIWAAVEEHREQPRPEPKADAAPKNEPAAKPVTREG